MSAERPSVVRVPIHVAEHVGPPANGPVTAAFDLRELVGADAAVDEAFRYLVGLEGDSGSPAIQFRPELNADGTRGLLVFLLSAPTSPRELRLVVERVPVNVSSTVSQLPRVFSAAYPRVQVIPDGPRSTNICIDGSVRLGYRHDPLLAKPYFYPVIGPGGRDLTRLSHPRDFNSMGHAHHRSLWIEHANVNQYSFEGEDPALLEPAADGRPMLGIGRIVHRRFTHQTDGPVFGSIGASCEWLTQEGDVLLAEERSLEVVCLPDGEAILDLTLDLRAVADIVSIGKSNYGILAIRVAGPLEAGHGSGLSRNAVGGVNERETHTVRSAWLDYSGPVSDDEWNGIAVLDHPNNPGHPNGWHVRDDGWFCASPFMFTGRELRRGESIRLQFRIYLHRGPADPPVLDMIHQSMRMPPRALIQYDAAQLT